MVPVSSVQSVIAQLAHVQTKNLLHTRTACSRRSLSLFLMLGECRPAEQAPRR